MRQGVTAFWLPDHELSAYMVMMNICEYDDDADCYLVLHTRPQ